MTWWRVSVALLPLVCVFVGTRLATYTHVPAAWTFLDTLWLPSVPRPAAHYVVTPPRLDVQIVKALTRRRCTTRGGILDSSPGFPLRCWSAECKGAGCLDTELLFEIELP